MLNDDIKKQYADYSLADVKAPENHRGCFGVTMGDHKRVINANIKQICGINKGVINAVVNVTDIDSRAELLELYKKANIASVDEVERAYVISNAAFTERVDRYVNNQLRLNVLRARINPRETLVIRNGRLVNLSSAGKINIRPETMTEKNKRFLMTALSLTYTSTTRRVVDEPPKPELNKRPSGLLKGLLGKAGLELHTAPDVITESTSFTKFTGTQRKKGKKHERY